MGVADIKVQQQWAAQNWMSKSSFFVKLGVLSRNELAVYGMF
jgi:hypothetical protein